MIPFNTILLHITFHIRIVPRKKSEKPFSIIWQSTSRFQLHEGLKCGSMPVIYTLFSKIGCFKKMKTAKQVISDGRIGGNIFRNCCYNKSLKIIIRFYLDCSADYIICSEQFQCL